MNLIQLANEYENKIWYTNRGLKQRNIAEENKLVLLEAFKQLRKNTIQECINIANFYIVSNYILKYPTGSIEILRNTMIKLLEEVNESSQNHNS